MLTFQVMNIVVFILKIFDFICFQNFWAETSSRTFYHCFYYDLIIHLLSVIIRVEIRNIIKKLQILLQEKNIRKQHGGITPEIIDVWRYANPFPTVKESTY